MAEHYAYCREKSCEGCAPTLADLEGFALIEVWAEMLRRCIAQKPTTKTHVGAMAAIRERDESYRELAANIRREREAHDYWGVWSERPWAPKNADTSEALAPPLSPSPCTAAASTEGGPASGEHGASRGGPS